MPTMARQSSDTRGGPPRVSTRVDFAAPGKQQGFLDGPQSRNDSAWGSVRIPVTVVSRGNGPTVLFLGGSHGDEYEGPIALMKLARTLQPAAVSGRVIILPAYNLPAVRNGTRLSPIDGRNMNRVYPGRRDGTVTEMIAHFVQTQLLPLADVVLDIHSGGKTMIFAPCAVMHEVEDVDLKRRTIEALLAFGAPYGLVLIEPDDQGLLDSAAEEMGKIFLGPELGGGGMVTHDSVAIAESGIGNLLRHLAVVKGEPVRRGAKPTRLLHTQDRGCFTVAEENGMYEVLVDLSAAVTAGTALGQIHFVETPGRPPVVARAERDGLLICRHAPGLVQSGDCLAVVAQDYPDADLGNHRMTASPLST